MLSPAQLDVLNRQLWPDACKAKGWKSGDREFRRNYLGELLGRPLDSARDIGSIEEFTRVKDHLLELANVLSGQRGAAALPDDNALRTRRWVALRDIQCLLLYVDEAYVRQILKQRFARGGVCPTAFDTLPLQKIVAEFKDVEQLNQLLSTFNERLHAKGSKRRMCGHRVQRGHTIHQMRQLAHVPCDRDCRECHPRPVVTLVSSAGVPPAVPQASPLAPEPELVTELF